MNFIRKIIRLIREVVFVLWFYSNPWVYYRERLKLFPDTRVILKLRNGIRYALKTNTNEIVMLDEIWRKRIYDPFLSYISNGGTVIDIGANNGVFSIKAARYAPNVRVVSYEPFPVNFELLRENIALNNLRHAIFPHQLAVGGQRRKVDFFFHERDLGGGSFREHGDRNALRKTIVSCITLENIFQENAITQCDYLKMDCEGAEEEILYNTPDKLFRKIRSMTIEWHDDLSKSGFKTFKQFLDGHDYKVTFNKKTGTIYAERGK